MTHHHHPCSQSLYWEYRLRMQKLERRNSGKLLCPAFLPYPHLVKHNHGEASVNTRWLWVLPYTVSTIYWYKKVPSGTGKIKTEKLSQDKGNRLGIAVNGVRCFLSVFDILTLQSLETLACPTSCLACLQCPQDQEGTRVPLPLLLGEAPFCGWKWDPFLQKQL